MQRVVRHTGEVKKDMDEAQNAKAGGGDASGAGGGAPAEHRTLGIETRVLVATGLLGLMTYAIFKHDPVPRKSRPKNSGTMFLSRGKKEDGFSRRKLEEEIEQEVDEAEEEIDDEFDHTDLDDDELDVNDDEDDEG